MGTLYKITDKVWGISDLPWPFFYGIQGFVILKTIIGGLILCLVTILYPLLYILGVWYLIKNKKKPNWVYFALYTGLMMWYIFCIVKFLILGNPHQVEKENPPVDRHVACAVVPESKIGNNGKLISTDDRLDVPEDDLLAEPRHYRLTVRDPQLEYEWLNTHRVEQGLAPIKLSFRQIESLAGIYAWNSRIQFNTQAQLLNYLCKHVDKMQRFKVSTTDPFGGIIKTSKHGHNEADEYNDRLEDYLDDPEDEIEYNPEVFDFQDD